MFSSGLAHDTPIAQAKLAAKSHAPSIPPRSPNHTPGKTPKIPSPLLKALQPISRSRMVKAHMDCAPTSHDFCMASLGIEILSEN